MRAVAEKCNINIEDLYKSIAWPLYKTFQHPFDAFKHAIDHEEEVLGKLDILKDVRDYLMSEVRRRMTTQPLKIRADFELSCFAYEGIDAIKDALKAGLALSQSNFEIKVFKPFFLEKFNYNVLVPSHCTSSICGCHQYIG